ncbi:hypothetical protein ACLI4U_13510 [Natrialbaceae archaeon A-CW2]
MIESPVLRLLTICLLFSALFGLFVFYGTLEPAPEVHDYPSTSDLEEHPDLLINEQAEVGGTVVDTDPTIIKLENGHQYVIEEAPEVDAGQELSAFVTVREAATDGVPGTLEAHDGVAQDQWETAYMYAVSIVAALWVLARILRHWRLDIHRLIFVPATLDALNWKNIHEDGESDG